MKLPHRRQFLHLAAGAAALPAVSRVAQAQAYPTRPITMIVPAPAGGPTDSITRILIEHMRSSLGQPIVIENGGGAGGTIAVGRAARANPDGYTLVVGNWGNFVVTGAIYSLAYDLQTAFEPISPWTTEPFIVVAKKTMAANNLRELVAWLKANSDKASIGTSGIGGPSHISGVIFQQLTGTRGQFVPYRGAAPAMQDLVAGQVDVMVAGASAVLLQKRADTTKTYAVAANNRLKSAPDIPTADEAGLPNFHLSVWHGLFAPKGTPKGIIDKLNTATVSALSDPTVSRRLRDNGQDIYPPDQQTPQALATLQKVEIEKWWPIIKAAGIKAE
jgi:tripartite-type tricarboxylate transporter receptor subunit TctC